MYKTSKFKKKTNRENLHGRNMINNCDKLFLNEYDNATKRKQKPF